MLTPTSASTRADTLPTTGRSAQDTVRLVIVVVLVALLIGAGIREAVRRR